MKPRKDGLPWPLPCPFCGFRYRGSCFTTMGRAEKYECPDCGAEGPFPQDGKPGYQKAGQPQAYYDRLSIEARNRRAEVKP